MAVLPIVPTASFDGCLQFIEVALNLPFDFTKAPEYVLRRTESNPFIRDFLIPIDRQVVLVLPNLLDRHEERPRSPISVLLRIPRPPLRDYVRDVVLSDLLSLVV